MLAIVNLNEEYMCIHYNILSDSLGVGHFFSNKNWGRWKDSLIKIREDFHLPSENPL